MRERSTKRWLAAAALAAVLGAAPAARAATLPIAGMGEWEVVALDDGLFAARATGNLNDTEYVYGTDGGFRDKEMTFVSWSGSADLEAAVQALSNVAPLSARDLETLKAYGVRIGTKPDAGKGSWSTVTGDGVYGLIQGSNTGVFGELMLAALEESGVGGAGTLAVSRGYCSASELVSTAYAVKLFAAAVSDKESKAFAAKVKATCAVSISPPTGTVPAWPIYIPPATAPPGWTPPTRQPGWVGDDCSNIGQQFQCVDMDGSLCMCLCDGAGNPGHLRRMGGCSAIPSTPIGSTCTPAPSGFGPCGTNECCTCSTPAAAGAPAGSGTWVKAKCGSEEIALGALLLTGLLGLALARRPRRSA